MIPALFACLPSDQVEPNLLLPILFINIPFGQSISYALL